MGLDIRAYRGLTLAPDGDGRDEYGEAMYQLGYHTLYPNDDFPGRAGAIVAERVYKAEESFHFRAGSYSGYNHWRDQLARLAGYRSAEHVWQGTHDGPFRELINFSDCEGVIGAEVSAKLAADFAAFQSAADAHPDDYFREKYAAWRKAFEMAAQNGAVEFG